MLNTVDQAIGELAAAQYALVVERRRTAAALALFRELEWVWFPGDVYPGGVYRCPSCFAERRKGHIHDCQLAALLT